MEHNKARGVLFVVSIIHTTHMLEVPLNSLLPWVPDTDYWLQALTAAVRRAVAFVT